ncbi:MAG: zinc-binding dehydrogenase [Candidatus Bathyarchaeia archaeon]
MKYVRIHGPRDIRVEEVQIPTIGSDDILVRVKACGICGSDIHRYVGDRFGLRLAPYPLNSGHEYCGDVVDVGVNVSKFKVGDRVTLGLNWVTDGNGAFAEYIRIPRADDRPILKVPSQVSYEEAAQIEPLTVAINGFHAARPLRGDKVLILGAGPIGLSVLQCCRIEQVGEIIVSEVSKRRLQVARQLGAAVVNPSEENLEEKVKAITGGRGVDVTFECAGSSVTAEQAIALTRRGGRIVLIAHYGAGARLDAEEIVSRNLILYGLMGSTSYFPDPEKEALKLILEGKVELRPLISHEFPLEEVREAFETAANPNISVKVLIKP